MSTPKRNIEAIYPLSPMQQGMLFHSLREPESGVYCEQLTCTLRGALHTAAFEQAWQQVMQRHAVLRTSFVWRNVERPMQVVQRQVSLPLEKLDWRGLTPAEQRERFDAYLQADRRRGFDLAKPPLVRMALMRIAEDAHYLAWSHHHALMDGWSLPLLLQEVFTLYEHLRRTEGAQAALPPLPPVRPYRDYIAWLQAQDPARAEAFWRQALAGFTTPTRLPLDRAVRRDLAAGPRYEETIRLPADVTAQLQSMARQERLTMSTVVQGAWALLLSRYSGEEDVVFGATVAGRPAEIEGVERMVGLFINTIPVRAQVIPAMPAARWLRSLQDFAVEARQFEHTPLVQVHGWSEVRPRSLPLFESIIVFENYPVDAALREQGRTGSLTITDVRSFEQTNFPITLVSAAAQELPLHISYDVDRFSPEAIRRLLGQLARLLAGMASDPMRPVGDLPLLTEAEQHEVLVTWNQTDQRFPAADRCIHELFAAQAERTPNLPAVVWEDGRIGGEGKDGTEGDAVNKQTRALTYAELDARANQLARHLVAQGVRPGEIVGLLVERSPAMVVGLLGILKAGAAYLPLDPAFPPERLAFMLADSAARVVVTQQQLLEAGSWKSATAGLQLVLLDTDWPAIAQHPAIYQSTDLPTSDAPAYVIYTSGSTGTPKGVVVSHTSLVNHACAMAEATALGPADRVLQIISLSFDAAGEEIYPTLISGATLVLAGPLSEALGWPLIRFCERQGITVLHMPASVWHALVDDLAATGEGCAAPLRLLMLGGDTPSVERLRTFTRLLGRAIPFLNLYGPTETTITATYYATTTAVQAGQQRLPIGRPIANVQVYVVDRQMRPVPVGVPGELLIGGAGVALGYLNRPKLTAERFVPDPFAVLSDHSADTAHRSLITAHRLYRTGDLVRWLPDGNLEFLGRADEQVKIRGFRVEPGEIEAALKALPTVKEAVVMALPTTSSNPSGFPQRTGDRRLVAYVVPAADLRAQAEHLRAALRQRLPDYMVPATFVMLSELPLTATGKIDRRSLPAPEEAVVAADAATRSPRTPVEEVLTEIWARILNAPRVGVDDNFFELGGHSLLATQVMSRVREAFGVELPLQALFDAPTVAGLAQRVQVARAAAAGLQAPPIVHLPVDGPPPLSFAQQRLWFLDQLEPGNLFYNIPTVVRLQGRLDVDRLQRSLQTLVRRHAQLRTTFRNFGGQPVQVTAPAEQAFVPLAMDDLTGLPADQREGEALRLAQAEVRQPFQLDGSTANSLLRARLIKLADDDHVAVLTVHHIVADGWSMAILVRELGTLYHALALEETAEPLPPLPIEYTDFAAWQRQWLQGEVLERQLAYWREQLSDSTSLLDLPIDRPRPAVMTWRGATEHFVLPKDLSERLLALSRQEGATLFMTLLAAYQTLLHRYSGQSDINVGTPIAGRHYPEVENVVGFFVNTLVMRARFEQVHTFRELLKQVRKVALDAYTHQDVPFEMLVDALQPERALSHSPLFQVAFGLQNIPLQPLELPDLTLQPLAVDSGTAKFDLTLAMAETEQGLGGTFEYNTDLFDAATVRRMVGHLQTLLQAIAENPDQPIATLPLLTPAERHLMLEAWNQTALSTPIDQCAHRLFEKQAAAQPDRPAAIMAGRAGTTETLTYAELNRRANQLARYLCKLGVGPETIVGIAIDRTPAMIVSILGVLKAGGAYLPLDPTYPQERLRYMIEDAQIPVLLTMSYLLTSLPQIKPGISTVALDTAWPRVALEPEHNLVCSLTPFNAAYVIYTSGSTGQPKGAVLRHRGLSNLAEVQRLAFDVDDTCRVLQFSPLSFDASVWEVFMALANGAALVLAPQELLASGLDLRKLLADQRVTHVTLPPSVLAVLEPDYLPDLRVVVAAGERCTAEIVRRWAPGRRFFDAYGPTETTVCASMGLCDPGDPRDPSIGRPIGNCQLYIVDANLQPVPIGVAGELLIGGVNVGRGYLNRPELTAERFIPNPFAHNGQSSGAGATTPLAEHFPLDADHLLYRTGDLVRYRPDGNIEFLGRSDDQVKVRGFRIELGEVEAALREHPAVQDAVVTARGDVLHAYFIPTLRSDDFSRQGAAEAATTKGEVRLGSDDGAASETDFGLLPAPAELKAHLRRRLPEYMVPATFTVLDAFPRSPAGKVDRRRLPAPDQASREATAAFVAPRTPVEERLAAFCVELLRVERVGVEDNFFALGGHSLLATQLISRIRAEFGVELPLRALFEQPTVAGLAQAVEQSRRDRAAEQDAQVKIADVLQQVQSLSPEQVKALLAARLADQEPVANAPAGAAPIPGQKT